MALSLAELRKSTPPPMEQRAHRVCLRRDLVAEVQALRDELTGLAVRRGGDDDDAVDGPPDRLAGGADSARVDEIKDRLEELVGEMAEYEAEVRVAAKVSDGDWRRWTNAHPAREKGQPGYLRDIEVTGGYCNAEDLIDDLGTYFHAWDGEEAAEGDWDAIFAPTISGGDKKDIARLVVAMYEQGISIPKSPSGTFASRANGHAAGSPAPSASPTSDSTAGSRESSTSTSTTTPDA